MPTRDDVLTPTPREESVKFRGVTYTLRELSISEFDSIAEKATKKVKVDDGTGSGDTVEVDRLDGSLQSRLMLAKCLIEPKGIAIADIPTRVYGALNRIVNSMHFGDELDEIKAEAEAAKKASEETSGSTEETPSGN
jgi:hypothetical protein